MRTATNPRMATLSAEIPAAVIPQSVVSRLERINSRTASIGVIGLGYVGLPLTLLLSEAGFKVTGFDIDASKVENLQAGRSYIHRIPQTEILARAPRASVPPATTRS